MQQNGPVSTAGGLGVSAKDPVKHTRAEDAFGLACGTFAVSLGIFLLQASETVTGGTAGLSLLLAYATGVPFGVLFVIVNLPFFALALWQRGWVFTLRSALAVVLVSLLSQVHTTAVPQLQVQPVYGSLTGNLLAGIGILILFRHRCSMGGFNIIALIAQDRFDVRAGYVHMAMDLAVILAALVVIEVPLVLVSAAGAVLLNLVLALNHRPGRYTGY